MPPLSPSLPLPQLRGAEQERINALTNVSEIRAAIEAFAGEAHAEYPQYAGYWSGEEWKLGFVKRTTKTRLGLAFQAGDVVLFKEQDPDPLATPAEAGKYVTAYSLRNDCNTALQSERIEPLAVTTTYRHAEGLVSFGGEQ